MSKPLGVSLKLSNETGLPVMRVRRSTLAEDAVWDAVVAALDEGWTVERFRQEAAEAWAQTLRDRARSDAEAWHK